MYVCVGVRRCMNLHPQKKHISSWGAKGWIIHCIITSNSFIIKYFNILNCNIFSHCYAVGMSSFTHIIFPWKDIINSSKWRERDIESSNEREIKIIKKKHKIFLHSQMTKVYERVLHPSVRPDVAPHFQYHLI